MAELVFARSDDEYEEAAILFKEYAAWLNIDLSFQKFDQELKHLKEMYAAPMGSIILYKAANEYAGCIAIRRFEEEIAEVKRMYVKPAYRNKGIAAALLDKVIIAAKAFGYKKIRLDTLNTMLAAMKLYKKNGFYEIPAYYFNPEKNAVYFEKLLK